MTPLALALALVAGADGGIDAGIDFDVSLYAACPEAPPSVPLDGGLVLLPEPRARRVACLMATCETDRRLCRDEVNAAPPPWWWVAVTGALVLGVVAGAVAGFPW